MGREVPSKSAYRNLKLFFWKARIANVFFKNNKVAICVPGFLFYWSDFCRIFAKHKAPFILCSQASFFPKILAIFFWGPQHEPQLKDGHVAIMIVSRHSMYGLLFAYIHPITRWWFQTFCFTPICGMIQFDWYFSDGLKPPTRYKINH